MSSQRILNVRQAESFHAKHKHDSEFFIVETHPEFTERVVWHAGNDSLTMIKNILRRDNKPYFVYWRELTIPSNLGISYQEYLDNFYQMLLADGDIPSFQASNEYLRVFSGGSWEIRNDIFDVGSKIPLEFSPLMSHREVEVTYLQRVASNDYVPEIKLGTDWDHLLSDIAKNKRHGLNNEGFWPLK